jgi:hypothetical protein
MLLMLLWKLCKAVYGLKDAGAAFEQHKEWAFMTLGAKRLWTDRAVYFFTEPDPGDQPMDPLLEPH